MDSRLLAVLLGDLDVLHEELVVGELAERQRLVHGHLLRLVRWHLHLQLGLHRAGAAGFRSLNV